MHQPPSWAARYAGIEFRDGGRSVEKDEGLDCWGLVRLVLMEQKAIVLPEYAISESDLPGVNEAIHRAQEAGDWIQVMPQCRREFDVVEMSTPVIVQGQLQYVALHVGILIGDAWVLHIERATASRLSPYYDARMQKRILGFWRHRELARL